MATGPGKYDHIATMVREQSGDPSLVVVIILDGNKGDGFSVQVADDPDRLRMVPDLLESLARDIRQDLKQ